MNGCRLGPGGRTNMENKPIRVLIIEDDEDEAAEEEPEDED